MSKKAFTLVELLAVIIVLGFLLAIIIPKIFSTVSGSKEDVYKTKESQLKKAAEDYVLYNNVELPDIVGNNILINLGELVNGKFINEIKDLDDNSICGGFVIVTKTNKENYSYLPCISCTNYETENSSCDIEASV